MMDFFGHDNIRIVHDGGISDVPKLLYTFQYLKGSAKVAMVSFNVLLIAFTDIRQIVRNHNKGDDEFLITKWFLMGVLGIVHLDEPFEGRGVRVFSIVELLVLLVMMCILLQQIIVASWMYRLWGEDGEMHRWTTAGRMFRNTVQDLQHFSGVRLLHYLTPTILGNDVALAALWISQRFQGDHTKLQKCALAAIPTLGFVGTR